MRSFLGFALISFGVSALPLLASGSVIEGFNLTGDGFVGSGNPGAASLPVAATTADPNVIAGSLNVSANFVPENPQTPSYVGPDAIATHSNSLKSYLDFSVTPNAGQTLSVTGLDANIVLQSGANEVDILYSTDGLFADAITVGSVAMAGSWTGKATSFDLSAVSALQGIPDSQTTTFFLEFATSNYQDRGIKTNASTFSGNALQIDGTTAPAATPEPASIALAGIASLGLLGRRRRNRNMN